MVLLIAGVAGLFGVAGGSASLPPLDTATSQCPPNAGRLFCVSISTYKGLARQGGVQVNLKVENRDNSTLTHPAITLSWTPNSALTFASGPSASNCKTGTASGATI